MKALSTTILIVVTAVVILVAALVVVTIFGIGVGTVSTLTAFRSQCATQCSMTCKLGNVPPTWYVKSTIQGQTQQQSCHDFFLSDCASAECGGCPAEQPPCPAAGGSCMTPSSCAAASTGVSP